MRITILQSSDLVLRKKNNGLIKERKIVSKVEVRTRIRDGFMSVFTLDQVLEATKT